VLHHVRRLVGNSITFGAGYCAGVVCAIVSQPADSMVSQLSMASNKGKSMRAVASEVGIYSLMARGLGSRIMMTGTLTALQWYTYDTFKAVVGLETTGNK
jgi:solute carrier family 25 (mitochondrial phosphate transporter), member 3